MKLSKIVAAVVIVLLFVLGVISGYLLPHLYPDLADQLLKTLGEHIRRTIGEGFRQDLTAVIAIFTNNVRVALINIVGGFLVVVPLIVMMANGIILGLVVSISQIRGVPLYKVILLIVPHGVLELTAMIYSAIVGVDLGVWLWSKILLRRGEAASTMAKSLLRDIIVVVALLAIAAFVEVYITPILGSA